MEWENKILDILATPEWSSLYNSAKNDIVDDGFNHPDLKNHFYISLLNSMKNNNATLMRNKLHLHQDGIGFCKALRSVYRMSLTRNKLRKRISSIHIACIKPNESIDSFELQLLEKKAYIKDSRQYQTTIADIDMHDIFIYSLVAYYPRTRAI